MCHFTALCRLPTRRSSDLKLQAPEQRHHFLLDGIVKFSAIFRRVVESAARAKGVVEIILKSGVGGDLLAQPEQRSEEHTSELQSHSDLVCRLLLEKKNIVT